ncbi:hypothetical protein FHS57_006183 [Runella defluvii]|uniref:HYR domain-containing protein n=1 Tax=Runella defluvii TaxID=370973 RepID=A0A7W5ZR77_9BACT|nr:HYR domain-containing protein [Runella defluvii]MBB3842152.1 hypothetical protein [Runella defluvii]
MKLHLLISLVKDFKISFFSAFCCCWDWVNHFGNNLALELQQLIRNSKTNRLKITKQIPATNWLRLLPFLIALWHLPNALSAQCTTGLGNGDDASIGLFGHPWIQSFQVSCTGKLTTIVLKPTSAGGSAIDVINADSKINTSLRLLNSSNTVIANATIGGSPHTATWGPGNTYTFDFSAANITLNANTTYKWELFNVNLTNNQPIDIAYLAFTNTSTYALGNATIDGANYPNGNIHNWDVNVVAACTNPTIITHPANATATVGGTANFSVAATGANLSYQWQYAPIGSGTFTDIATATNATYTAPAAKVGQHRAKVLSDGGCEVFSNAATLSSPGHFVVQYTLPAGQNSLFFKALTNGVVNYTYTTSAGNSGSGSFSQATPLGLPAFANGALTLPLNNTSVLNEVVTLAIEGTNLKQFQTVGASSIYFTDVLQWSTTAWTSVDNMFYNSSKLTTISATDKPDLSIASSMRSMFRNCSTLVSVPNMNSWNTSNIQIMDSVFVGCKFFNQSLSAWNLSNVTSTIGMFAQAAKFNNGGDPGINDWDVSKLTNASFMFAQDSTFNQPVGKWNMGNVTGLRAMFFAATNFNQDISNWDVRKGINFQQIVGNTSSFNQNLGKWNLKSATNLSSMLSGSGMDCKNYSATLVGWANNPELATGRTFQAAGKQYGTDAVAARTLLTTPTNSGGKGWSITDGGISNTACIPKPVFSAIPNQATCDGQNISNIAIELSGEIDGLTLAATSSNAGITPMFTFGGSGASRTLTIATAAGQIGASTITVKATNSLGGSSEQTFLLELGNKVVQEGTSTTFATGLNNPVDIDYNANANVLFVSERTQGKIIKIDAQGNKSDFATGLNTPEGISYNGGSNILYVAENQALRVSAINSIGERVDFRTNLEATPTRLGGAFPLYLSLSTGSFFRILPTPNLQISSSIFVVDDMVITGNGDALVTRGGSGITNRITSSGSISVFNNTISYPTGIATSPINGKIYITSDYEGQIKQIDPDGSNMVTYKSGIAPIALTFDSEGNLYGIIRLFSPNGSYIVKIAPPTISYESCNAKPVFNPTTVGAVTACQRSTDGSLTPISLSVSDPDGTIQTTTVTSSNPSLVAATNTGSATAVQIALTQKANQSGSATITVESTDNKNGKSTLSFTVTVKPNPVATATPSTQNVCSGGAITAINLTSSLTGTSYSWTRDNTMSVTGIAANGSGNISGSLTNTTTAPVTVTFTITPTADGCQGAPTTATVVVNPTPNVVATPSSQTSCQGAAITAITFSSNVSGATYSWIRDNTANATGIAASGTGSISGSLTNTTNSPLTVTFTITPTANNCQGTSTTATVTIGDAEPPTITCPANISVNSTSGLCGAVVTYTAPVGLDNCSGATTTQTAGLASGATFPVGVTTNTFKVMAANGQTATCSFTVTVVDAEPPTITCPANISVNSTQGLCGAVVTYTAPVGLDNCSGVTTTQTAGLASGATFPVGVTTNTFQVMAANGQTATCSFTVTVVDAEPPTITCPANISVNSTSGLCGAVVTYTTPVGLDNCSGVTTTQTAGLASGATFPVGVTTNTFQVMAANGQTATCSFTVTVVDVEPPTITCPANISVNNTQGLCGAVVTYTAPVGLDNCSGVTTTQTTGLASGATFPVGVTTNTFKVMAANGQTATCSFTVTVVDAEPPTITCPANVVVCEGATVTFVPPVGTDNCSGAVTTQTAGFPSGTVFPVGITTNTFKVTAANGQTTTCSFTVTVQSKPTITLSTLQQTLNEGNSQTFCDTDANPVNGLQFNGTGSCVVGNPVWRVQVGSGAWSNWSATAPVSQSSNNQLHRYQAACDATCPVTYTSPIELTINYRASMPQNVSLLADGVSVNAGESKEVCNIEGNSITFNATCSAGEMLLYSVDGGEYSSIVPTQLVDNQYHNYRVRCRKSDGTLSCVETESGVMRLRITSSLAAPVVSLNVTSGCGSPVAFSGTTNCGTMTTIWYNALTNTALPTLSNQTPTETTSYYARCQASGGCMSEKSNVVTYTVVPVNTAPIITASQEIVCTGTTVTITANCPAGSTTSWNTGITTPSFEVAFSNVIKQTYWAKCIFAGGCQSSESVRKDIYWNAFVVMLINIGESKSAIKTNDRSAWTSQFITRDGGPELDQSTQVNPTLFYVENANKMAPRYWTIHADACGLGTNGSLTFDMQAVPEMGVIRSFNTHENNAPYFMYANREGWTELYAQNHPAYGFYQDNGAGGNVYDSGLPKGLYKLSIRYWDQKGWGSIYPSTRKPQGNVLAYQEYWFRIQSKDGVGVGAARTAESEEAKSKGQGANGEGSDNGKQLTDNGLFATVLPNPVTNILRLKVQDSKGQVVQAALTDATGREVLQRKFVPETNTHQEEFGVADLQNGVYFLKVNSGNQQVTLKVVKLN